MVKEKIDLILGILAWGLIALVITLVVLKMVGVLHSPTEITFETIIMSGIFLELARLETKIGIMSERYSLLWKDFIKRKRL